MLPNASSLHKHGFTKSHSLPFSENMVISVDNLPQPIVVSDSLLLDLEHIVGLGRYLTKGASGTHVVVSESSFA